MKVLVINSGSSSLKYQLFETEGELVLAKGQCERIGIDGRLKHQAAGKEAFVEDKAMPTHKEAIKLVMDILLDEKYGAISSLNEIGAVGHRIVHGGPFYTKPTLLTEQVLKDMEKDCMQIAPVHTPGHVAGMKGCMEALPDVPEVLIFDTAFHQTMPKKAFLYPINKKYYEEDYVRKYGFHGTSHKYVSQKAAEFLGKKPEELKIVTCHLGNGSSLCAVKNGECVDTSMGYTPLAGVMMGTRTGSLDPSVIVHMIEKDNLDAKRLNDILNKESGVLAVSGVSSDFRDVEIEADKGNEDCKLALDMFAYQCKQYVASYAAAMGGVDAIVFTAGIGENNPVMRADIVSGLEFMGVKIDKELNDAIKGKEAVVSAADSKVKVLVIPTNEELMIAKETLKLVNSL